MKRMIWKRTIALWLCIVMVLTNGAFAYATDEENMCEVCSTDPCICNPADDTQSTSEVPTDDQQEEQIDDQDIVLEEVIENSEDEVPETTVEEEEVKEEVSEPQEFKYDDEVVEITVIAKDGNVIPEGVSLKVVPINKMEITDSMSASEKQEISVVNDQYDSTEQLLKEKVENGSDEALKGFLAYDITFVDADGNEVEPKETVQVSMKYKSAVLPDAVDVKTDSDVCVMHLVEDKSGEVVEVVDLAKENLLTDIKVTDEHKIKKAEFNADSFSVYAIIWTAEENTNQTVTGEVVGVDGNTIAGSPDMTIDLPEDGSEIGYEDFNNFFVENTEYVLDSIQLISADDETTQIHRFKYDTASGNILYSTHETENEWLTLDSVNNTLRFVYDKADATELSVTAKFANADKTGALAVEDAVIFIKKEAGESVSAEKDYQTFAEYTDGSKKQMKVGEMIYQFEGAYVTSDGADYWTPNVTNTKVDALRILEDKLQFRETGTTTWTDMSTYTLSLVYEELTAASMTITLQGVLADATKLNCNSVTVKLEKELLADGTYATESSVDSIEKLVADGTIPNVYIDAKGVTHKFRNAVLVSSLNSFTRRTYYTAVNAATPKDSSVNVLVKGLKLNDTSLQYQDKAGGFHNVGNRVIVLVYAEDLHTVETIDSKALGVTMRMINFKNVQTDFGGPYAENVGRTAGLLTKKVGTNGYPSTTKLGTNNFNFERWFGTNPTDSNVTSSQEANYLFLKDYYDETGTFHYSGFENFASMDKSTGNFTVYEEIGASSAISAKYSHQRGHFLPYNTIAPGQFSSYTNMYDPMGGKLTAADSRYNENLYITKETVDYNFGMYLEAEFAQPNNGMYRGEKMVFEFNGDDDFWVYLDGVLVLDIGGIHNAQSGYINFATGEVVVKALPNGTGTKTTIKDMFIDALGRDGVNDYNFKDSTFADGSLHKMQVFYMERGKSASNLYLNFNLPTVPSGTIQVEKQLGNTDQEAYTDLPFAFRVMAQKVIGSEESLDENGKHIEKYAENEYVALKEESGAYVGVEDNKLKFTPEGVFTLKPTEVANFPNIQADRKYYVEEVDLAQLQLHNKVIVAGDTKYTENGKTGQDDMLQGEITKTFPFGTEELIDVIKTTERAVSERKKVTFINYITDAVLGNIQIEKKISKGDQNPDYGFNFKVTVQDNTTDNKMVPYVGYYYLKDAENNYLYLDSAGQLQKSGLPKAYGRTVNGVIPNVKVGQKAEIRDFYQGTRFFVEEVDLKNIYETPVIAYDEKTCTLGSDENGNTTYHVNGNTTALVKVTNKEKYQYAWNIIKQSPEGNKLVGAQFELVARNGSVTYYGKSEGKTGIVKWYTNEGRTIVAESIPVGSYYLTETVAPSGYVVSEEQWTVVINPEEELVTVQEDRFYAIKGRYEGAIPEKGFPAGVVIVNATTTNELDKTTGMRYVTVGFYYLNDILYELPSTGGLGIYWVTISGMILMMGAALILHNQRCKEVLIRTN